MSDRPHEISPPEKLSAEHDPSGFNSGERALDDWLRRRALQNEARGSSRTYVICADKRVVGYLHARQRRSDACAGSGKDQAEHA